MAINPLAGSWTNLPGNFIKKEVGFSNKTIFIATIIAIFAIGATVAGSILFDRKIQPTLAKSLLGSGGGILGLEILLGMISLIRQNLANRPNYQARIPHRDQVKTEDPSTAQATNKQPGYTILSWNIGVSRDFDKLCATKHKMSDDGLTFAQAYKNLDPTYQASSTENEDRFALFAETFQNFSQSCGTPDFICLQESWEIEKLHALPRVLPQGYASTNSNGQADCVVAWNTSKFTLLGQATLDYDPNYVATMNSSPDTVVLLQDNETGMTICVGSAHLRGMSLTDIVSSKDTTKAEALERAQAGDNQARYDLATMQKVKAHLYIYAGDFNATREHYPLRLQLLENEGYVSDQSDTTPTIYDSNLVTAEQLPMAVKLDHIYAKGGNVQVQALHPLTQLDNPNRASDHLPIGAVVTF